MWVRGFIERHGLTTSLLMTVSVFRYCMVACADADHITCPFNVTQLSEMGNTTTTTARELLSDLFQWCSDDAECAWMYHQAERRNLTVFRHLVNPQLSLPGQSWQQQPLVELLCKGTTLEDANKVLWLQRLKANRDRAHPICDVNHRLVLRAGGLNFECECRPDKTCSDGLFDLVPFYVVLSLVTLLALALFILKLYETIMYLHKLDRVTGSQRGALKTFKRCLS